MLASHVPMLMLLSGLYASSRLMVVHKLRLRLKVSLDQEIHINWSSVERKYVMVVKQCIYDRIFLLLSLVLIFEENVAIGKSLFRSIFKDVNSIVFYFCCFLVCCPCVIP